MIQKFQKIDKLKEQINHQIFFFFSILYLSKSLFSTCRIIEMLETRFAGNNTDKNKHYIIANADFSELNWKNTCDIIRNDKSVKLTISNIIFSALSRDYSFL